MQHQTKKDATLQSDTLSKIKPLGVVFDSEKHKPTTPPWQVGRLANCYGLSIPVASLVSELSGVGRVAV